MRKTMKKLTQGATRLLVLALGLGLVSTAWATAPTATAVWQSGEFGQTKNGYSIALNNNVINADGDIVFGGSSTKGIGIEIPSGHNSISVLVKISDLPTQAGPRVIAAAYATNATSSPDVGLRSWGSSNSRMIAFYDVDNASTTWKHLYEDTTGAAEKTVTLAAGYLLFSYDLTTVAGFVGTDIASLSGGVTKGSEVKWPDRNITYVSIGGPTGKQSVSYDCGVWEGMKIEKIAIFVDNAFSNDGISEYTFPTAGRYANWEYAKDVFTWTSAGTADMSSSSATYYLFDRSSGTDTATEYNGGSTTYTGGGNFWKYWTMRQPDYYSAPGFVLRLIAGKQSTIGGSFAPLTLGGMIVEAGATGYNFYHAQGTDTGASDGKAHRSTIFGDCTGETETWFEFNESVSFNRPGRNTIAGTVNMTVASGKSVSINTDTTATGYSANFDPAIYRTISETGYNQATTTSGGELKMHGEGTISVTSLNASGATLNYSDLGSRVNTNPFINGTLTINEGTTFVLPEGATSPYKVATTISGTYPTSITIGDKTYAAAVSAGENAGEITWEINTATIDVAGDDYALSTIFTDPSSTKDYSLTVTADATLDVGTSEVRAITIDVAEGKTLTLSGTSLTATTIYVTGKGTVKVITDGMLVGTVKGDGVLKYVGVRPTTSGTDLILTNDDWKGTLCLTYNKESTASGAARQLFPQYWGSSNSKIKWNGVAGYFADNINCPAAWFLEDLVENATTYYALKKVDGFGSNNPIASPMLSGSGTFYDNNGVQALFKFAGLDNFTGVINIDSSGGMNVQFGATAIARETGKITILSGASVTIPNGSTWGAPNGFSIKSTGTLTVDNTQSIKVASIVGTLNIAEGRTVTLTGNDDSLNYGGSGTVNVYGTLNMADVRWTVGASNEINLYEHGEISGNGPSNGNIDLNNNNGTKTIHAYGNATISATIAARCDSQCEIIVDDGKTLTCSGLIFGSYAGSIAKRGAGTLKITNAGSTLPTREAGYIELATGTWNLGSLRDFGGYTMTDGGDAVIKVVQNEEDYGKGLLEICNIDSSIEHVTVVKIDSTETTLEVSAGTASMGDGTVVVGGKACTYDWEFNGDLTSVGYSSNGLSYDGFTDANSFEDSSRLYIRTHPYYDSTYTHGLWTWADDWTVAIKCTVPTTTKGMVITFGNQGNGCVGLATSENDGKVILFKAAGNGAAETISEMAVSGRSTAQHLYIFSKTSDGKMKVYCDDTLIDDKSVSGIGSLKGTLQVGSLHGGVDYINLNRPDSEDPATIDFVQVYNYGISDAQRLALISNYAWVNPNQYTRTVSGDESLSSSDAWTKPSDSSSVALPVTDADAIITTSTSSAALTVNADFEADTLTVNSGDNGAALRIKAGAGTLSAAKVVVNAPVTIEYGAVDFSGSVLTFGEGGSLTYDFSGVAINSRTTRLVAKLTGLVDAPADLSDSSTWPVQVITHTDAASLADCYESTFSYDTEASAFYYVSGPDHDWGSEVYYTGGYWSSDNGNTISVTNAAGATTKVFANDTVVIPAYYPNATTWSDNTLPANVTKIRVSKSKIKVCSGANSGDIFTGVTWTVDSGCVLWFGVDSKTTSLGAMTINGPGSVECGNITINGAMSGNAPVKILDSVTTRLTSTGSIASTHTISGNASSLISCAAVPPAMTFASGWAGTVELPSFAATGQQLNDYGVSGSKIKINGVTSGYLYWENQNILPEIVLAGNFNITDMSKKNYTFSKFSGEGNITFSPGTYELTALTITELAVGYSGTVANNMANTTLNIGALALAGETSVIGGTKLLPTGGTGTISVGAVTVGGEAQSFDLCYVSDGVYVAAAEYDSVNYYSVAAAIAVAGDANLADITLLNGCTTVPAGYYINDDAVVKCPAAIVYAAGDPDYYNSVQAAVNAANGKTYAGDPYEYVAVYANAAVTTAMTLKIKPMNEAVVTVSVPGITSEYALNDETDENGVVTYTIDPASTDYTWVAASGVWDTTAVAPWRYDVESTPTQATRAPSGVDNVAFASAADVTVGANVSVSTMTVSSAITLTKVSADVTVAATTGGIVLTDAGASVTVSGVTLSPTPTTTVANSYVKLTGSTYSVDAYNVITINAPNATVTRADTLGTAIKDGDMIRFTVAASTGYVVTGVTVSPGNLTEYAGEYSYVVNGDATITVTVAQQATISGVTFNYMADYQSAKTVTATVSAPGTYTLTVGGKDYNATAEAANSTITFNNVTGLSLGANVDYTITAGGTASGTYNSNTTVGNRADGWVVEDSTHTGNSGTGTWETPVTYSGTVAAITNNTYTANTAGDGIVTLTTVVKFGDEADPEVQVGDDAQVAIRIQTVESTPYFQVYGKPAANGTAAWQTTTVQAEAETTYTVSLTINYTTGTFTASVQASGAGSATPLGGTWYLATSATKISAVAYKGVGEFTSLNGSFISGDIAVTVTSQNDVLVSSVFISQYLGNKTVAEATELLAPGSTTKAANGLNYFENYALGLNPTVATDKPIVSATPKAGGGFTVKLTNSAGVDLAAADNVSLTYRLMSGATPEVKGEGDFQTAAEFTIDPSGNGVVKYYKIEVNIGAK